MLSQTLPACTGRFGGYHKVVAVRFPYLIFYLVRDDKVLLRAVLDGRRDPHRNRRAVSQRKQDDDTF
jgi:hypothetical protein